MFRLKSLKVDGFKNLNDFKIDFDTKDGVTVLIGNNASGKSNVLEAISAIFSWLYNSQIKPTFDYELEYIFTEDTGKGNVDVGIKIIHKNNKYSYLMKKINLDNKYEKVAKKEIVPNRLPSQVISLYSGEELRLWEDYYESFYLSRNKKSLASNSYLHNLNMLYVNKYYWDIALLTMYASDIDDLQKIVKSELKTIKIQINTKLFSKFIQLKPNNVINSFLYQFMQFELDGDGVEEKHSFNLELENFKNRVDRKSREELFNLLSVARLPKDPKDKLITDLELAFDNGTTTKDLSEGQKKQILLKLALDVLADENPLILFDEPDAHIHISNKKLIPKLLKKHEGKKNTVLTTHSPTLAHSFNNHNLRYLIRGKIDKKYNKKEEIINNLSNNFMGVTETQILLQSNKDILIVEGKTDEAYISQALKVLQEDNKKYKNLDFNFLLLGGSDPDNLNKIIKTFSPQNGQKIMAFLDHDSYECVKKVLDIKTEKKDFRGEYKNNIYIDLYPIKKGFNGSNFVVEDYFPIEVLRDFVIKEDSVSFLSLKSKFNKNKFAKKCQENNFDKRNFDGFKTLFDKILEIKK